MSLDGLDRGVTNCKNSREEGGLNGVTETDRLKSALEEQAASPADLIVVYDGECIFCNSYVKLLRLREAAGRVLLVDAREGKTAALVRKMLGLDLDNGMLALYGGRAYYGADAMHVLSGLTSTSDTWNATLAAIFSRRWLARLLYPALKLGRRTALFMRGRSPINASGGGSSGGIGGFFERRVPAVTARTLGICRALIGTLMLYFLLHSSPQAFAGAAGAGSRGLARLLDFRGSLTALSASPDFISWLYWSLLALTCLFAVGLFTRLATVLLVTLLWLGSMLGGFGHFINPFLLGMTATVVAPWGDAVSIDALLRRKARPNSPSPFYGYPIWLLGLCIGLAYAAAGLSKIILTDGAWLWDTGARFGFLADANKALSDIGLTISNSYALALVASIVACIGQIVYVYACFTRSPRVKYAICFLVALPFLFGLMLTMGLFWWPWGILVLVLYLPWLQLDKLISKERAATLIDAPGRWRHRNWFLATACALIALQLYAVLSQREFEPVYSNYPMYATSLRAGGETEVALWQSWTSAGTNYRPAVQAILDDGNIRDVSLGYRIGRFVTGTGIYNSAYADLSADAILASAGKSGELDPQLCSLVNNAILRIFGPRAHEVRYYKQFYLPVDGQVGWRPIDTSQAVSFQPSSCKLVLPAKVTTVRDVAIRK